MTDVETMARSLYDARAKPMPPITDSSWERYKANTPKSYAVLVKVAEGLIENAEN